MDKITRIISKINPNLQLKLNIVPINDKFFEAYSYSNKDYMKIEYNSYVTIEKIDKDKQWKKDNSVLINDKGLMQLIRSMRRLKDAIYGNDLFAIDKQNKLIIFRDRIDKYSENIFRIGSTNQNVRFVPAILYDTEDEQYEGVILYLNNTSTFVEMSIDEFETMLYVIEKIDLYAYSQMTLNFIANNLSSSNTPRQNHFSGKQQESNSFISSKGEKNSVHEFFGVKRR